MTWTYLNLERKTPDPETNDLPDPEESCLTAGNLPEGDLDNIHPSTQPQEGKENTSVMD